MNKQELIVLYQQMSDLTAPICGTSCVGVTAKYRCCSQEYCDDAKKWAKERYNIDLIPTGVVPGIPFMGENGCIVPPHLRPRCTIHACPINHETKEWREKRHQLIEKIVEMENKYNDSI